MHKRKGRNPSKISLNLLKRCVFLIHWRCCTIYETHRRRVKAMVFQIMTELEEKEQRQKLRDAWPHRKFTLTSSSSWIIPSVVNGFTKMKTTMALRMARPKCHQYSHLAAKARDNGNSPLPTQNGPVLPLKESGPPKAWCKVSALLYNTAFFRLLTIDHRGEG